MNDWKRNAVVFAILLTLSAGVMHAESPVKLDWSQKVFGDGLHNAFTDLTEWRGAYYLCFRHGKSHGSLDGEIRIMRSNDLRAWEPCATLDTLGDDRDPHFTSDGAALYCYFGVWDVVHQPGAGAPDRGSVRSHFARSENGTDWSPVQGVYEPGWWLWRVRRLGDFFYSAAYTAVRPKPSARETRLLRSVDGLAWDLVSTVTKEHMTGEADLEFLPGGGLRLLTRAGGEPGTSLWYETDAAMQTWRETDTGVLVHAPVFAVWNGERYVAGRAQTDAGCVTRLWRIAGTALEEVLTLPSSGDTSYPGLIVAAPGGSDPALYISWYSQHEDGSDKNAASVYVGRIVADIAK